MTASRHGWIAALSMLLLAASLIVPAPAHAASKTRAADDGSVTKSKRIERVHRVDGADVEADARDFSVTVSKTTNLRFFEEIKVTWSGAHPTGGIVADPNSGDAKQQEYPVVLLECAGDTPESCWTATAGERFAGSYSSAFPAWRIDRYASPSERTAVVQQPDPRPAACFSAAPAERWLPFRGGNNTTYAGGPAGCGGMAPEAANVGGLSVPSNTTYGVTNADGTGRSKFTVWTAENNASLGCSAEVTCSLVVVPVLGISCDVAGEGLPDADRPSDPDLATEADENCRGTGNFSPGQVVVPAGRHDATVSGELWWSASNWRNRVTIPLSFAPSSNVCDIVGDDRGSLEFYGSELLTQAALQWLPKFCLDDGLFNVKHVQTGEIAARSLLNTESSGVHAIVTSDAPDTPFDLPVVNAPIALSGFAVAYTVDDAKGQSVATLKLTPRLLAKLLTESYPAINTIKEDYKALAKNPLNITLDPEFIALNPGITKGVPASESASTILTLSSDSDVTVAMTRYIDNDPAARKWLDGEPDEHGMVVNPNYKSIALPVTSWPLLDTFQPTRLYESGTNDCLRNNPVPYLPLVAAPLARLNPIAQAMQFSLAKSQIVCQQIAEGTSEGEKLIALGRQTQGFRFMLGVVSVGDARRFALDTASLHTHGDSFVAPTDDGIVAAGKLLVADEATNTWPIPYKEFATERGKAAYPGAMVVYAQAPTEGVPATDAARIATFLEFAAGEGQKVGAGVGNLAPGFVAIDEQNGLGALQGYTVASANAVKSQSGVVPSILGVVEAAASAQPPSAGGSSDDVGPGTTTRRVTPSSSVDTAAEPTTPVERIGAAARRVAGVTAGAAASLVAALLPLVTVAGVAAGLSALGLGLTGRRPRRRLFVGT